MRKTANYPLLLQGADANSPHPLAHVSDNKVYGISTTLAMAKANT
jgi:hypothetical protein